MKLRKRKLNDIDVPFLFPFFELISDLQSYILTFAILSAKGEDTIALVCKSWNSMRKVIVEKHVQTCIQNMSSTYVVEMILKYCVKQMGTSSILNVSFLPENCLNVRNMNDYNNVGSVDFISVHVVKSNGIRVFCTKGVKSQMPPVQELAPYQIQRDYSWIISSETLGQLVYRHCPCVYFRKEEKYVMQRYDLMTMEEFFLHVVLSIKKKHSFYRRLKHRVSKMKMFTTEEFIAMIQKNSIQRAAFRYLCLFE